MKMMYDMCAAAFSNLAVESLFVALLSNQVGTRDSLYSLNHTGTDDVDLSHRSSLRSLFQRDGECTLICWYVVTFVRTEWMEIVQ